MTLICPFCGETIPTKHSFCVVCGADLAQPAQTQADTTGQGSLGRLSALLTKPIGRARVSDGTPANAPAQSPVQPPAELPVSPSPMPRVAFLEAATAEEPPIVPDFMRKFL